VDPSGRIAGVVVGDKGAIGLEETRYKVHRVFDWYTGRSKK